MEVNKPLVSIVTGYYNRKENLMESIQSVLDQSYENFEYLVFDDCSTDGTSELLLTFQGHPRFNLIRHEENMGLTKGLIATIARARGKYIAIHGAGDISYMHRIERQVELFEAHPGTSLVGCVVEDHHDNKTELLNQTISNIDKVYLTHGEVMYPRELYYRAGGYVSLFKMGQFTLLKFELKKLGDVRIVPEVLYKRIHFKNGITKNKDKRISQKIYIELSRNIASRGYLLTPHTHIILRTMIFRMTSYDFTAEEIEMLKIHLKEKSYFLYFLFICNRNGLFPKRLFRKFSLLFLR